MAELQVKQMDETTKKDFSNLLDVVSKIASFLGDTDLTKRATALSQNPIDGNQKKALELYNQVKEKLISSFSDPLSRSPELASSLSLSSKPTEMIHAIEDLLLLAQYQKAINIYDFLKSQNNTQSTSVLNVIKNLSKESDFEKREKVLNDLEKSLGTIAIQSLFKRFEENYQKVKNDMFAEFAILGDKKDSAKSEIESAFSEVSAASKLNDVSKYNAAVDKFIKTQSKWFVEVAKVAFNTNLDAHLNQIDSLTESLESLTSSGFDVSLLLTNLKKTKTILKSTKDQVSSDKATIEAYESAVSQSENVTKSALRTIFLANQILQLRSISKALMSYDKKESTKALEFINLAIADYSTAFNYATSGNSNDSAKSYYAGLENLKKAVEQNWFISEYHPNEATNLLDGFVSMGKQLFSLASGDDVVLEGATLMHRDHRSAAYQLNTARFFSMLESVFGESFHSKKVIGNGKVFGLSQFNIFTSAINDFNHENFDYTSVAKLYDAKLKLTKFGQSISIDLSVPTQNEINSSTKSIKNQVLELRKFAKTQGALTGFAYNTAAIGAGLIPFVGPFITTAMLATPAIDQAKIEKKMTGHISTGSYLQIGLALTPGFLKIFGAAAEFSSGIAGFLSSFGGSTKLVTNLAYVGAASRTLNFAFAGYAFIGGLVMLGYGVKDVSKKITEYQENKINFTDVALSVGENAVGIAFMLYGGLTIRNALKSQPNVALDIINRLANEDKLTKKAYDDLVKVLGADHEVIKALNEAKAAKGPEKASAVENAKNKLLSLYEEIGTKLKADGTSSINPTDASKLTNTLSLVNQLVDPKGRLSTLLSNLKLNYATYKAQRQARRNSGSPTNQATAQSLPPIELKLVEGSIFTPEQLANQKSGLISLFAQAKPSGPIFDLLLRILERIDSLSKTNQIKPDLANRLIVALVENKHLPSEVKAELAKNPNIAKIITDAKANWRNEPTLLSQIADSAFGDGRLQSAGSDLVAKLFQTMTSESGVPLEILENLGKFTPSEAVDILLNKYGLKSNTIIGALSAAEQKSALLFSELSSADGPLKSVLQRAADLAKNSSADLDSILSEALKNDPTFKTLLSESASGGHPINQATISDLVNSMRSAADSPTNPLPDSLKTRLRDFASALEKANNFKDLRETRKVISMLDSPVNELKVQATTPRAIPQRVTFGDAARDLVNSLGSTAFDMANWVRNRLIFPDRIITSYREGVRTRSARFPQGSDLTGAYPRIRIQGVSLASAGTRLLVHYALMYTLYLAGANAYLYVRGNKKEKEGAERLKTGTGAKEARDALNRNVPFNPRALLDSALSPRHSLHGHVYEDLERGGLTKRMIDWSFDPNNAGYFASLGDFTSIPSGLGLRPSTEESIRSIVFGDSSNLMVPEPRRASDIIEYGMKVKDNLEILNKILLTKTDALLSEDQKSAVKFLLGKNYTKISEVQNDQEVRSKSVGGSLTLAQASLLSNVVETRRADGISKRHIDFVVEAFLDDIGIIDQTKRKQASEFLINHRKILYALDVAAHGALPRVFVPDAISALMSSPDKLAEIEKAISDDPKTLGTTSLTPLFSFLKEVKLAPEFGVPSGLVFNQAGISSEFAVVPNSFLPTAMRSWTYYMNAARKLTDEKQKKEALETGENLRKEIRGYYYLAMHDEKLRNKLSEVVLKDEAIVNIPALFSLLQNTETADALNEARRRGYILPSALVFEPNGDSRLLLPTIEIEVVTQDTEGKPVKSLRSIRSEELIKIVLAYTETSEVKKGERIPSPNSGLMGWLIEHGAPNLHRGLDKLSPSSISEIIFYIGTLYDPTFPYARNQGITATTIHKELSKQNSVVVPLINEPYNWYVGDLPAAKKAGDKKEPPKESGVLEEIDKLGTPQDWDGVSLGVASSSEKAAELNISEFRKKNESLAKRIDKIANSMLGPKVKAKFIEGRVKLLGKKDELGITLSRIANKMLATKTSEEQIEADLMALIRESSSTGKNLVELAKSKNLI